MRSPRPPMQHAWRNTGDTPSGHANRELRKARSERGARILRLEDRVVSFFSSSNLRPRMGVSSPRKEVP